MTRLSSTVLLGIVLLYPVAVSLQADTWSLVHDNDMVFDSDDRYSAGLRISWIGDTYEQSEQGSFNCRYINTMSNFFSYLGISFEGRRRNGSIALQEMMITPDAIERTEPVYDDVPYTGILTAGLSLFSWDSDDFEAYHISFGVVGQHSGAESIQKVVHKIVGATDPKGWDNQLGTHMVLQTGYVRGYRQYVREYDDQRRFEWFNSYHVDIGNFYSGAGVGTSVRYGSRLPNNFTTASGLLNSVQSDNIGLHPTGNRSAWEVRAGFFVSGIAYLYLYDEGKRLGYHFDRPRIIPKAHFGATLYLDDFHLSLDLFPDGSAGTNPESNSFGRISLVWQLQ